MLLKNLISLNTGVTVPKTFVKEVAEVLDSEGEEIEQASKFADDLDTKKGLLERAKYLKSLGLKLLGYMS